MKLICFILSFYVVVLSTIPCCSDGACNSGVNTAQADNHANTTEEADCTACSPFFSCCSCSACSFIAIRFDFSKSTAVKQEIATIYAPQFIDDYFTKIWQPPKLG